MKSIDNLREWANGLHGVYINRVDHTITVTTGWDAPPDMDSVSLRDHVNGILDAIEREVEELRDRDYRNGREDAEGAVEFADRLCRASERREDVTLWGVDYTPLPVDADGVPIHVGDVMDAPKGEKYGVMLVAGISFDGEDWYFDGDAPGFMGLGGHFNVAGWTHHHAQTVEDVLWEFADAWAEWKDGAAMMNPVETFAAKLRLAGEDA